jgi:glycosyltransferase involved in cell wall biosynthesis
VTSRSLRGRRVLVVGINYAPEHSGIAPYTTATAEHLASCGARVAVLAGVPHYPHWTVPAGYRRHSVTDESIAGVRVRRLRHYVPASQSAARRALYEATFGAQVVRQRTGVPDVVVAVVPSLLGALAAARIARRHRVPFVVVVQDLMGRAAAQSGMSGGATVARLTTAIERRVLRRATAVVTISEAFRDRVVSFGVDPARVRVIRNWSHVPPPSADRDKTRAGLGWDPGTVVALHAGNMGLKQGLENVVEAARLAHSSASPVRFVLMGDGSQRARLAALAGDLPTIELLPPCAEESFPEVLAAADVLLVNELGSVVDMSLPSKLTSYFVAGRPVIAAVPSEGGTAAEVRRSGAGSVVPPGNPAALLGAVLHSTGDAAVLAATAARARAYADSALSATSSLGSFAEVVAAALDGR